MNEFGFEKVYPVNRLDRLTSGLMIMPTSVELARILTSEFVAGTVRKEYVARCRGRFPSEEVVCDQPLLTVDRQMGLNIVHPEGRSAKTIFNLIRYDEKTDSSVISCKPLTGRSHQIRVHLQWLGYPIANDPVYSDKKIWGPKCGKNGIDLTPSDKRVAPSIPSHLEGGDLENPDRMRSNSDVVAHTTSQGSSSVGPKLLPRETGEDIGMGSPVELSEEAVGIISRLRNMKDEDEDWGRWRDVVFKAKGALRPPNLALRPPPPSNRRKRNKGQFVDDDLNAKASSSVSEVTPPAQSTTSAPSTSDVPLASETAAQITLEEALQKVQAIDKSTLSVQEQINVITEGDHSYCPECYVPLHPDPKPEKLYIFLHALRYTLSLGTFTAEMPEWASEDFIWDQS